MLGRLYIDLEVDVDNYNRLCVDMHPAGRQARIINTSTIIIIDFVEYKLKTQVAKAKQWLICTSIKTKMARYVDVAPGYTVLRRKKMKDNLLPVHHFRFIM